jgi:hypothetical protein
MHKKKTLVIELVFEKQKMMLIMIIAYHINNTKSPLREWKESYAIVLSRK